MSDTETQDTALVVPTEDQPNEDAPVNPPAPAEAAVAAHDAEVAGQTADGQPTAAVTTDGSPAEPTTPATRAKASDLEGDLRKVLDEYVEGKYVLPEGDMATPHTLAAEIAKRRGDGKTVSSGAVSAALARWQEIGFATLEVKPTRFIDYTDAARAQGLTALKQAFRANKSAARKAVQEPAPVAAATPVAATPEAPVATEAAAESNAPAAEGGPWEAGYPVADGTTTPEGDTAAVAPSDGTPF